MTSQVRFGTPVFGLLRDSDDDFLGSVLWRSSETTSCVAAESNFSLRTIGMCWKQQCLERQSLEVSSGKARFCTLDDAVSMADSSSVLAVLGKVRRETGPSRKPSKASLEKQSKQTSRLSREATQLLRLWLESQTNEAEESHFSLLACCELLALYGSQFPAEVIGGLWRVTLAGALAQADSFTKASEIEDWQTFVAEGSDCPDAWAAAGLLPFVCGLLFDGVKGAPRLARTGRASLNDQLLQVTDEDGTPVREVFENLFRFGSIWSDGLLVARLFDVSLFKKRATKRFESMLQRLTCAVRDGGILMGSFDGDSAVSVLRSAAELLDLPEQADWKQCLELSVQEDQQETESVSSEESPAKPKKRSKKKSDRKAEKKRMKIAQAAIPSWQSDDTDSACLRTSWAPDASLATVRIGDDPIRMELVVNGVPLLAGPWSLALAEGGEKLELENKWECVCWSSDVDADYLELQLEFEGGPVINRYIMLSRKDQYAIISDIVSGSTASRIDLISMLPLAPGVSLSDDTHGREQLLKAGGKEVRVFPLALPQDVGVGTAGQIGVDDQDGVSCLASRQVSESGTLFSPIVLDWATERREAPAEWRQLTVTRATEIDRSGAAAFRLQVGKLHLVIYRSMGGTERYRTFLGYQSESETVIGYFTKSGVIDVILLVE